MSDHITLAQIAPRGGRSRTVAEQAGWAQAGTSTRRASAHQPRAFDVAAPESEVAIHVEAGAALERNHFAHYEATGLAERRRRVQSLFDVMTALRGRDLVPIHPHAEAINRERFVAGVGIAEVRTAFNVLQEALWRRVGAATGSDDLAHAIRARCQPCSALAGTASPYLRDACLR